MRPRLARLAAPVCLGALATALCWHSWATWPDVVVDAGREAYVAWRLAAGRRLYADVAYLNGPLSPYWNALWFRVAGVGLRTLFIVNLATLGAIVAVLHRLLVMAGGRLSATLSCAFFLAVLAFGQKVGIANYNYVFPYSHEMTHGLLLVLLAVLASATWARTGRPALLAGAGLALGLAFLTKPELFLAGATATATCVVAGAKTATARRAGIALALAGLLAPWLVAWALLARVMPVDEALRGTLGAWPWVVAGDAGAMPFYRTMLGIDAPGANVSTMIRVAAAYLVLVAVPIGLAFAVRGRRLTAAIAFGVTTIALAGASATIDWSVAGRGLPLAMLVLGAGGVIAIARRGGAAEPGAVVRLALVALAFTLLGKMILRVRLDHYGFVLAMPAACVFVAAVAGWLPDAVERAGGSAALVRAVALGALMVFGTVELGTDRFWLDRKTTVVGRDADAFRADARGERVATALDELVRRLRPDDTAVALPEGAMLNYLARRANPTPYVTFMPPELALFGEDRMVAALAAQPPAWVVLVDKDTSEYGVPRFGHDYGRRLYKWVKRHYRPAVAIGPRPLHDAGFGVELWQRAAVSTAARGAGALGL